MEQLTLSYADNVALFDRVLRVSENYDVLKKTVAVGDAGDELTFYYLDGFVEGGSMQKLVTGLLSRKGIGGGSDGSVYAESGRETAEAFVRFALPHVECAVLTDAETMLTLVLSGVTLVLGSRFGDAAVSIDARTYPARSIGEPEDDRVMKGARDGFVETLLFNTALLRRRVRDPALTTEHFTVGRQSRTDVVLCYMAGRADDGYVERLRGRLREIDADALVLGHQSLVECLIRRRWYNPFPKVRTTGRPDTAACELLEGRVLLFVDNSPEVIVLPTSLLDFLEETNDFYMPPFTGGYLRAVRIAVFFLTLFLIPVWFLSIRYASVLPEWIYVILPQESGRLPLLTQLLLVEFLVDGLRLASMNTPDMLSNSLSVVGGLILGDFAVGIGLLIPEVILLMAFVSIANFSQRSYQLGYALKFLRVILLVLTALLGIWGFLAGTLLVAVLLATNLTLNGRRSYLSPLSPFRPRALRTIVTRVKKPIGGKGER